MILPISTIKYKQWFYQYQQLNVNSDYQYQQLNINSDSKISTIKCKQWSYQYQQLNVNSDSTNISN